MATEERGLNGPGQYYEYRVMVTDARYGPDGRLWSAPTLHRSEAEEAYERAVRLRQRDGRGGVWIARRLVSVPWETIKTFTATPPGVEATFKRPGGDTAP